MKIVQVADVKGSFREIIKDYRQRVLLSITSKTLDKMLPRKNPYMYACRVTLPHQFIREMVDAAFSSSEETLFGKVFEKFALAVLLASNPKSAAEGLDGEILRGDTLYLLSIKSGSNWGNSSQHKEQQKSFRKAVKRIQQNSPPYAIKTVMVICYGSCKKRSSSCDADMQFVGQAAWYFLTGNRNFYADMLQVMAEGASEFSSEVWLAKEMVVNQLLSAMQEFQDPITKHIDFFRIVTKFHSSDGSMEAPLLMKAVEEFDEPETPQKDSSIPGEKER